VDGLDMKQTAKMLQTSWPDIRQALLQGIYRPSPVPLTTSIMTSSSTGSKDASTTLA
jgi:hypothetical protein